MEYIMPLFEKTNWFLDDFIENSFYDSIIYE